MNCKQVREELFGLTSGATGDAAIDAHLRECAECSQQLAAMRQTMSLLDEWKAPEPSAYFDQKLRARLREEAEAPRTFGAWLRDAVSPFTATGRRVAFSAAMTLLLGVGVALFQPSHTVNVANNSGAVTPKAQVGSAVADLQALDKNADLFANFDMLDDVQPQSN